MLASDSLNAAEALITSTARPTDVKHLLEILHVEVKAGIPISESLAGIKNWINSPPPIPKKDLPPLVILSANQINHDVFGRRAGKVFLTLLRHANRETHLAWPSVNLISDTTGIHPRNVQRDLFWLQNSLVNGEPLITQAGRTYGGVRKWRINPAFMASGTPGQGGGQSSHQGGGQSSHPEQIKGTEQEKTTTPTPQTDLSELGSELAKVSGGGFSSASFSKSSSPNSKPVAPIAKKSGQKTTTPTPPEPMCREQSENTRGVGDGGLSSSEISSPDGLDRPNRPESKPLAKPVASITNGQTIKGATPSILDQIDRLLAKANVPDDVARGMIETTAEAAGEGKIRTTADRYVYGLIGRYRDGCYIPPEKTRQEAAEEREAGIAERQRLVIAEEQARLAEIEKDNAKAEELKASISSEETAKYRDEFIAELKAAKSIHFDRLKAAGFAGPGFDRLFATYLRRVVA